MLKLSQRAMTVGEYLRELQETRKELSLIHIDVYKRQLQDLFAFH